jgi:hypothetical protein
MTKSSHEGMIQSVGLPHAQDADTTAPGGDEDLMTCSCLQT